ncbi:MAG: SDR family oxidoreductase [Chloroflexi bacterium]|nr:SDR family oxidoreductase [Chloroflexota bacterium]
MRLENKVAIITGGGSGIGRACSCLFAREGAKVVVAQRTKATAEETVATIRSNGGDALFIPCDVTLTSDVEKLVKQTVSAFGRIDILFNNAGTGQKLTPIEDMDEALWDRVYTVNVKSIFLMCKSAVPEMKKTGQGVIINTASGMGVRPLRKHQSAYASSKGAVIALTKALAIELAPHHIRVNCVYPTMVDTPLARQLLAAYIEKAGWEQLERQYAANIPLGRLTRSEDIAYAALYLACDEAAMLTGVCLNVDGGRGV